MLAQFLQNQFASLNRQKDPSNLSSGEYALVVNGRIRNGGIQPIGGPLELTSTLPAIKNLQGIYGFDNFLIIFGDGNCWIKDYDTVLPVFRLVGGFQMSATAPVIYCQEVPSSSVNYTRTSNANVGGVFPSNPIILTEALEGSPACIVCQDGTNQPFVILPDGTARVTQNWAQWTQNTAQEYVVIGTVMLYINDKLYVMMADQFGNYTQLVGSVSGRPLDFMVQLTNSGNKGASESTAGALSTAYSADYNSVTCLSSVGSAPSTNGTGVSFLLTTQRESYLINPNYTNLIFGEPTYTKQSLFSTGPANNFSVTDLIGDAALIDDAGIRSFNAILQTRFEGQNAPFSAKINPLFGDVDDVNNTITQTVTAATTWADYGFFGVTTIYGTAICIYDTLTQSWVSVDIFPNVTKPVKMFADIKTITGIRELFFITTDNRFYQYLAGPIATCGAYIGDFTPVGQGIDLHPLYLQLVFSRVVESGKVNAQLFMDSKAYQVMTKPVEVDLALASQNTTYPLNPPFGINNANQGSNIAFDCSLIEQGWKFGAYVTWNFSAMLLAAQVAGDTKLISNSLKQQALDYAAYQKAI